MRQKKGLVLMIPPLLEHESSRKVESMMESNVQSISLKRDQKRGMSVLLLGATGLIGKHCLEHLLASSKVDKVVAPTRRTINNRDKKLRNVLVDFDCLDEHEELFDVDAIICCIGTTIKQAGSRAAFRKVDFQYALEAAQLGRSKKAKAFYLVTAMGADAKSPFFYNRVKGELEIKLRQLEYNSLSIYQPSLLIGDRDDKRKAEYVFTKLAGFVNPLLSGRMTNYSAVKAETVAKAMVNECVFNGKDLTQSCAVNVYRYENMLTLASNPENLLVR